VLHDPLVTDDAQITSAISGAAAERKEANGCERRHRDRRECAFREIQNHSPLASERYDTPAKSQTRHRHKLFLEGGEYRTCPAATPVLALPESAHFVYLNRIVIRSGV
jgi:hypothetical protein